MKNLLTRLNQTFRCLSRASLPLVVGRRAGLALLMAITSFASQGQSNQCANLPTGLIGWWAAEGNANDFTGAHSGSFPYGSAFAAGVVGQAFDFDASSRRVSIADSPAFQLTNAMTLEAWVYPRAYGGFITFRGDNRPGLDNWTVDTYENGFVKFSLIDPVNNLASVRAPLALNQWQHIAATWDHATGDLKIYVNGVLGGQTNSPLVPIGALDAASEPAIGIGNHGGTFHQFPFNGLIDELGIYGRALTANEVAVIFMANSAGKCQTTNNPPATSCVIPPDGLVSWWRAENNALDESHTNAGTLVGGMGYAAGRVGQAFVFDGVDDGVIIPDAELLNVGPGQDFTVEAWIQAEPHLTEYGVMSILSKRVAPTLVNAQGYDLSLHYGKLGGQLADEDDQFQNFISAGPDLIDGAYHHVAMTVNRAATNGGQLYVDGQVVLVFDPTQQSGNLGTAAPFRIGRHASDWFNGSFKGRVDEAAFYRRALGANEITAIYHAGGLGKCASPTNPPAVTCTNIPAGIISWWRGENNFFDAIQSNHGSAVGGVSFVPGKAGLGMRFDGASHVVIPHHASLDCSNALTIELWYKPDLGYEVSYGLIDKRVGGAGANYGINLSGIAGMGVYYDDPAVLAGDDTVYGSVFEVSRFLPAPASGVFHHLAATFQQIGSNTVQLEAYVDGLKVRTMQIAGNLANTLNTTPVTIGSTAQGAGEFFKGIIDEVAIYSRALASNEIAAIYHAGSLGKCSNPNLPATNCVTAPAGLLAWWSAESNSLDRIGASVGSFDSATYSVGKVGTAFDFNGANNVVVPDQPSFNPTNAITIDGWVYPRALTTSYAQDLISKDGEFSGPRQYMLTMGPPPGLDNGTGGFRAHVGVPDGFYFIDGATKIQLTNWYHVAMTYDGSALKLFVNGNLDAQLAVTGPIITSSQPIRIGGGAPGGDPAYYFNGLLDELSIYHRALALPEIQSIYAADQAGKCPPLAQSPVITQQPQSATVIAGTTAQLDVVASGVPAPSYQWYFDGNPLVDQTNAALILSNVQLTQDGTYAVRVFNPSGSVMSSNATLTVMVTQAVVLVEGNTPGFYNDALGTILDGTAPQFPLPLGLGGDPEFYPADEPNLAAAAAVLGDWLTAPADLNANWRTVAVVPTTWELNTETAIIYVLDGGSEGVVNLRGDFDADNGIYVWVNGQYKFGARAPGLPSPIGQFEYANVSLGSLTPGSNYIQVLREDSGISVGYQVRITGTALSTNRLPPVITQSPTNQSVAAGSSATFSVAAIGTPELNYQWRFNAGDLVGQTNSSLSLPNVQVAQAGEYSVLVSNAYGSVTSSIAVLTVLTYPPTIASQPQDRTVYAGRTATLTVQATGTAPLQYLWWHDGTGPLAVNAATLTLANVQSNDAGAYQVIVRNDYGSATSRVAQLTIVPPPPCAPAPEGVIAWWPGQSNLWDVVGGFDAQLTQSVPPANLLYAAGKVGAALNFLTQPTIVVTTGGGLNLTTNTGLTIEGWIRPDNISGPFPIAEWNDGKVVGAGLLLSHVGPGVIEATLTDTNAISRGITFRSSPNAFTNALWQHVALTYDKLTGLATIYVGGNPVAQTNVGTMTPNTSANVYLGYRPAGLYASSRFRGALDEITLYNRALTAADLQAIIAADETGKCPPPPPPCFRPPTDIAAWWRGESNTVDLVAGNDAIRLPTNYPVSLSYQAGQLGTAFKFNGPNCLFVPRSEGLDVGTGSGLTVEAWIYPNTLTAMPIVEWTDTNTYGANLWLSYSRGPSVLEANLIDAGGGFHLIRSPVNTIRSAVWQHVAVTYDKTTGLAALYLDGNLVTSTNLGFFTPRTSTDLLVGLHPRATSFVSGDGAPPTSDYRFLGAIDELALYRRALTAAEIRNVSRSRPGKCLELPPAISRHPQGQVALEGGVAHFEIGVGGTAPFQYQWLYAGEAIAAATNSFLALTGIEAADAGLYSVLVSNTFGAVTSRVAALTVLPANQCLPAPSGLVALWRGESNTVDDLGSHPAEWGTNTSPAYTTARSGGGKVATAFQFAGQNHLQVSPNSNLDVGARGGFTIEGWIKPENFSPQPLWDWNDGRGNIGVGLMLGRTGPGALEVTLTDTNVVFNSIARVITLTTPNYTVGGPTNPLPRWAHVALTFDKLARRLALYVDGRLVAERSVPMTIYFTPSESPKFFSPTTTGSLYFGWRPSGANAGLRFRGAMDEMSVYYRALTPLELQAIYIVGSNGKCTPAPTCQSLATGIVSWWRGESNVLDSVDGNHGFSSPVAGPGIAYTNGVAGTAFKTSSGRYVQVPASSSLNVGAGSGFTFETWFRQDSVSSGTFVLASWNATPTNQGVSIGTSPTRGPLYLEANLVDAAGVAHVLSLYNYASPSGASAWRHLAVTYEKSSGQTILFLNGSPVVVTNLGSFTPRTTGNLYLGYRPPGNYPGGGLGLTGVMDETALYNRALAADEITANYRNVASRCLLPPVIVQHPENLRVNPGRDVAFQVGAEGNPLLRYQWGFGRPFVFGPQQTSALPGQTNSWLLLTNVTSKNSGTYWVQVTNAFGWAASTNIQLIVNAAPVAQPQQVSTPEDKPVNILLSGTDFNQDPLTFVVVTPPQHGTLVLNETNYTYTPAPNYHGPDSFTFKASDGLLESVPASVSIIVTPVNDPPAAASQMVATDEDVALPITLGAVDGEGDLLTYMIVPPAHGNLSGTAPDLVYTPHANYSGEDLFTFTVRDGSNAVSELAVVSISVNPVNDAPSAKIVVSPLDELPGVTNIVALAPACCDATLRLDASESTDVESTPLSYAWVVGTNVLSNERIVTNRFKPGTHEFTLLVSDGTNVTTTSVTVEIITPTEAVAFLKALVEEGIAERRQRIVLLNWLRQAGDAFERCHVEQGVHFLELFQRRVQERIAPTDAALAKALDETAAAIIEAAPDCDPCHRLGRDRHKGRHEGHDRPNRGNDRDRDGGDRGERNDTGPRAESASSSAARSVQSAPRTR